MPAGEPITVDGRLDESVWGAAPRVEHFIDYRVLRLESLETVARVAYGPDMLYVAFECFDPDPSGITSVMPGPDRHVTCDSVEVLIASPDSAGEFAHWIVDSRGTVFDARSTRTAGGPAQYAIDWNGSAQVKAVRGADRWTVEMALPAEDTGVSPAVGGACRALLCRNIVHTRPEGEEESNAVVFLAGSNFHSVEKFPRLTFRADAGHSGRPEVALVLRPLEFGHETTGEGRGPASAATCASRTTAPSTICASLPDAATASNRWERGSWARRRRCN